MTANFVTAEHVLDDWRDRLLTGVPPILYPVAEAEPLNQLEIGPGLINLIGGAPGAGKTAFAMQLVVDALRLTPSLKAVVCNVEMSECVLLDRQLSRLSGIPLSEVKLRQFGEEHAD